MFVNFDGIKNARDLGGIPLSGGKKVKSGRLLRSAGLANASDADIRRLESEFSLKLIADFRDGVEIARAPDRAVPGAEHHALPALPPFPDGGHRKRDEGIPDFDASFRRVYTDLAAGEEAKGAYREFFRLVLEAEGGGVLWHCTQGKDRTGVAAILLLTALGADWADIERDYFLSNEGLAYQFEAPMPQHMQRWPRETLEKLIFVYSHLLKLWLESSGGAEAYLAAIGVGEAEKAKLREYYTE